MTVAPRVQHNKRQSTYTTEEASFQASYDLTLEGKTYDVKGRALVDGDKVIAYRDEATGSLYVRHPDEFTPDRFTELQPVATDYHERLARALFPDDVSDGKDCRAEVGRVGEPCRICAERLAQWHARIRQVANALAEVPK